MRILIVTSCTGQKAAEHPLGLTGDDFAQGPDHVQEREAALADCLTPARDLYRGRQHVRLMRGVDGVAGRLETHLQVVSAGYGLIPGGRKIAPYECTFSGRGRADLRAWADRLGIPAAFRALMSEPYDLCLWLLGGDYLSACGIDSRLRLAAPTVALCGSSTSRRLPSLAQFKTVVLGNPEASRFSCGLVALKGDLAARLLIRLAENPDLLPTLIRPDTDPLELLDGDRTGTVRRQVHDEFREQTMIKIIKAEPLHDRTMQLEFSDGTAGNYDLRPLIARGTEMVIPLQDGRFFAKFFLELGALCWPNGFELSGGGIQQRLRKQGKLYSLDQVS